MVGPINPKKIPNTISTLTYRDKYRLSALDQLLRQALVAEKICTVDRSDVKRIESPYGSQPSTVVQAIAGTYTPATYSTTNDTLTVSDEVIVSEHIFDFEQVLTNFDMFASRTNEMMFQVAASVDKYVLNNLLEEANQSYTTPTGGFTTASNVLTILGNLIAKVAGYKEAYYGNMYLVVENTDLPGIIQAASTHGFVRADNTLANGLVAGLLGVDIHVVRTGTFDDSADDNGSTSGTTIWTNANHRLFGVKGVSTYAAPRGVRFEEKMVSGKTGREIVVYGYIGHKLWTSKRDLVVDITLA